MGGTSSREFVTIATQYCLDVVNEIIPACKFVKAACQRQLDDLSREDFPYHFDPIKASRPCEFMELLPHIKGEWAKRKELIRLEPWQIFIDTTVYGWVDKNGKRRFKTVYEEVPRKNSKSTGCAGLGLYALAADGEPGSEVYSAAKTRDQAKIVWGIAQNMVKRSPGLRQHFGVEAFYHAINVISSASVFTPLSTEGQAQDGLNVHLAIVDEIHAHKTREMYDVLETGTGSRSQPLIWCITTAGTNRSGIAYELREYLIKILQRIIHDDTFFGVIYTLDEEDLQDDRPYTDEVLWKKANPNYGVSVKPDDMARLAAKALQMPSARANFLTKRLNIWVNAETSWMDMIAWDRCGDPSLRTEDFVTDHSYAGLDLASKVDLASRAHVFVRDGHYYAFMRHYVPEYAIETSRNASYYGWEQEGFLVSTPGNVIDLDLIEEELKETAGQYLIDAVAYDPWQATQLATHCLDDALPMVEIRPTTGNFSEPMKTLEALVLSGKFHHTGDPVLAWCVSNVVCQRDYKDNIYPRKTREENKIDDVVALLMALNRALLHEDQPASAYEDRGFLYV